MTSDIKEDKEVEESKAPLISHLIELRDRLKWAAVAFFIAFIFSYFFNNRPFESNLSVTSISRNLSINRFERL